MSGLTGSGAFTAARQTLVCAAAKHDAASCTCRVGTPTPTGKENAVLASAEHDRSNWQSRQSRQVRGEERGVSSEESGHTFPIEYITPFFLLLLPPAGTPNIVTGDEGR
jgi:hypothetical protein